MEITSYIDLKPEEEIAISSQIVFDSTNVVIFYFVYNDPDFRIILIESQLSFQSELQSRIFR